MSVWEEIRYFIVSSYFSKIFVNYIGKTLSLLWRSSVDTLAKWSPATNHIEMNVSLWMRGTQYHFWKFSSVTPCHSVQWLFVIPSTAACQASLSITNSRSLLKFMSIELVMPSKHLVLCHPLPLCLQSFPASGSFQMSQFFASGGQSIGVSASASVLPMNIQDWFPLG